MPAITENYSLGQPVEIGKIHKELKKLWQERENAMTRASLINLALYSEKPGSLEKNTQLIARITENHACRALVIGANRKSKENRVEAWLNAHCHVTHAGANKFVRAAFVFAGRPVRKTPPERCLFPPRFRPATLPLVAGRFSRPDGPATLGVGESVDLR